MFPSFNILADALIEQVESRARRDDASECGASSDDDAAIAATMHAIPSLDLRTELRHDSIVEYQLLELALMALVVLSHLVTQTLHADHIAPMLLALHDAYGVDARGEART